MIRTDLAFESAVYYRESQQDNHTPEGLHVQETCRHGFPLTRVQVETDAAAEAIGKPRGSYLTLEIDGVPYAVGVGVTEITL